MNFRPNRHDVATDDGWGGDAVETPVNRTTQPLGQVNAPAPAKGWDRFARLRVQADQVAVASINSRRVTSELVIAMPFAFCRDNLRSSSANRNYVRRVERAAPQTYTPTEAAATANLLLFFGTKH